MTAVPARSPTAVGRGGWIIAALLALLLVGGCAGPLPTVQRTPSQALVDTDDTRLGQLLQPLKAAHPGLSGFHVFHEPHDAFAARALLAGMADRSIDAQYFLWHDDTVGVLLWAALWRAAERGVRVRLLLDDANTTGLDPLLAALDAHPGIELRLYNPVVLRGSRALGYLTDLGRLNQRMHNKSFSADNQVSVVGGRNIADAHFGGGEGLGFVDVDVVATGPIVAEVSRQFDLYWNSASAYPAAAFVGAGGAQAQAALQARFAAVENDPRARQYIDTLHRSQLVGELLARRAQIEWTGGEVLYDAPAKTLGGAADTQLLLPLLMQRMGKPQRSLDIVSPYFVPGADGTARMAGLAREGVRVRVLTNSLASSDERVVHAGYLKRRHDLLRVGVELYELKPGAADALLRVRGRIGPAKVAGLHAKTYAVHRQRVFVGSFNFDPRSTQLNTEMGLLIDAPSFAADLAQVFDRDRHTGFYEVRLAPDGPGLQWIERDGVGRLVVHDVDPQTTPWQRFEVGFLAGLPIDWLL